MSWQHAPWHDAPRVAIAASTTRNAASGFQCCRVPRTVTLPHPSFSSHQCPEGWATRASQATQRGSGDVRGPKVHTSWQARSYRVLLLLLLIYCGFIFISFTRLPWLHISAVALHSDPLVFVVVWTQSHLEWISETNPDSLMNHATSETKIKEKARAVC